MQKKLSSEELKSLLDELNNTVIPWCEENELSLHRAFELSRETDPEKYEVLSRLWSTQFGKEYLRSCFQKHGGILHTKEE